MLCLAWQAPAAAAQTLPPDAERILQQSPLQGQDVTTWDLSDLWQTLCAPLKNELGPPLAFAAKAAGYLLWVAVLSQLGPQSSWRSVFRAVCVLGFGALSLSAMTELLGTVAQTAQQCQTYLAAFVPVYSGAALLAGQQAGAAVYSGMFLAMAGFLSVAIQELLLPVLQIYLCFSTCACIWGSPGVREAAGMISRCVHWLLKACGIVFSFVLGLQNALAHAGDTALLRAGRGLLQGVIPVIGDAAASALGSAAAAVQLLKGSLALAAIATLAVLFLPVFARCLLYGGAFFAAGLLASAGDQRPCADLCRLYAEGTRLCVSVLLLYFYLVFFSTVLLLITGNGG